MSSSSFQVTVNTNQELCFIGRIDLTNVAHACEQAKQAITSLPKVQIDLSGIKYADSSSLAMLVECIRSAKIQHKDILFCNMPQFMLDLGRVCGLDSILPIHKPLNFHS